MRAISGTRWPTSRWIPTRSGIAPPVGSANAEKQPILPVGARLAAGPPHRCRSLEPGPAALLRLFLLQARLAIKLGEERELLLQELGVRLGRAHLGRERHGSGIGEALDGLRVRHELVDCLIPE